jgi:histidinol-phosphatase (PHP family)
MFLTDSHLHSICSGDGYYTMLEMAIASHQKGVDTLCFTDHCDIDDCMTGIPNPDCFLIYEKMVKMYEDTISAAPQGMTIRFGIELGEINHDTERAEIIAASKELDFVLGSLHNLRGKPDFYDIEYHGEEHCRSLIDDYMDELLEYSSISCYDVMAHIGYPVRYTRKRGYKTEISLNTYEEKLRQILRNLIANGKGIEINCSGFSNPLIRDSIPTLDILKLYRDLGGEIITVGSDAHKVEQTGQGLREGFEILRTLNYKYVSVFEKRKPLFLKL